MVNVVVPSLVLVGGIALLVWRTPIARWNRSMLEQFGVMGWWAARQSTPKTIAIVGTAWLVIGVVCLIALAASVRLLS